MRVEIEIDGVSPEIALECVQYVIKQGKISHDTKGNTYYCWATAFETREGIIYVHTKPRGKADCFRVYKTQ